MRLAHPTSTPAARLLALLGCLALLLLAAGCGDDEGGDANERSRDAASASADEDTDDADDEAPDDAGNGLARVAEEVVDLTPHALDASLPGKVRSTFSQQVDVFGATVLATKDVPRAKVMHAAAVIAEYVDNDEDGAADDPDVPSELADVAYLVMARSTAQIEDDDEFDPRVFGVDAVVQPLYASETRPGVRGAADATIEEVHHLLLNAAWQPLEAPTLDEEPGSGELAAAMDEARGGRFDGPPRGGYPDGAWYTYDDETCEYDCMLSEYAYWLHTTLLGGQVDRCEEISGEWRPCTPDEVREVDSTGVAVLDRTSLGAITVLPDGRYRERASR